MALKIVTGQVARGEEQYLERKDITDDLWSMIEASSNVLIAAPRRVGKTSIMHHVCDNPKEGYSMLMVISESVHSEDEFYKLLFESVIKILSNNKKAFKIASTGVKGFFSKIKGFNVLKLGVELDATQGLDYFTEFKNIIEGLSIGGNKLVIMIDEFSQTVENIKNTKSTQEAVHFLQTNRELRQMGNMNNKVQFVYAGSIGLENIVSMLESTNLINDLSGLEVPPLRIKQAMEFMDELIELLPFKLTKKQKEYILLKIEWLILFYIQLVIKELKSLYLNKATHKKISNELIDNTFSKIIKNRNYFEHWLARLKKAFILEEYKFAIELLNIVSINMKIDRNQIIDIAIKHNIKESYINILHSLEYDGYISKQGEERSFKFNSPILRMWWYENVAIS